MIGGLDISLRVLEKAHTGVKFEAMVGFFGIRSLYFEYNLIGLLGQEVEEDGLAKTLVAERFSNGEMLYIYKVIKGPVGKYSYWLVAIFGYEKMKFAGITLPENREWRALLFGKRLFKQFLCKMRMVAVCKVCKCDHLFLILLVSDIQFSKKL